MKGLKYLAAIAAIIVASSCSLIIGLNEPPGDLIVSSVAVPAAVSSYSQSADSIRIYARR